MIMVTDTGNILGGLCHGVKDRRSKAKGQGSRVLVVANTCVRACKGM